MRHILLAFFWKDKEPLRGIGLESICCLDIPCVSLCKEPHIEDTGKGGNKMSVADLQEMKSGLEAGVLAYYSVSSKRGLGMASDPILK